MKKSLIKILWSNHKKANLIGASVGMILGLVIILSSIQVFIDVQVKLLQDEQVFKPEFIVINKQISLLNTLKVASSAFNEEEINDVKNQDFTSKVGRFISNKFKLGAYTKPSGNMPAFYAELFFESVEDEYLDIQSENWKWKEGNQIIPIILPKDYLTLYNFGFAQGQGLPQFTEEMIGKAAFTIRIEGNGKQSEFTGKIVGFSGKINSILVPYNFLTWANNVYGTAINQNIANRLVLVLKDPTDSKVTKYLEKKGYQSNNQNDKLSKIASLLKVIISIVGIIGLAIILLSVMVFILSFNVIIAKSAENIIKLIQIGFHYKVMFKIYLRFYIIMLCGVLLFSLLVLFPINMAINSMFEMAGFVLDDYPHPIVFISSIVLTVILFVLNSISLLGNLKKLSNS